MFVPETHMFFLAVFGFVCTFGGTWTQSRSSCFWYPLPLVLSKSQAWLNLTCQEMLVKMHLHDCTNTLTELNSLQGSIGGVVDLATIIWLLGSSNCRPSGMFYYHSSWFDDVWDRDGLHVSVWICSIETDINTYIQDKNLILNNNKNQLNILRPNS